MKEFQGVYPAIVTPLDAQGKLNEHAFRKIVDFNIAAGVQGFWVAGGTGESILLEDEENRRIAQAVADQCAGRAKPIMHVGAPTTDRAARMAEAAAEAGVDAICCVPPFFYRRSDEEIAEHYRVVGAAANLPLFVYNLPSATGVEITPGMMERIQDRVPQLKGLKHSAPSFANVHVFAQMGLDCFIGSCRLMLPALTIGACGCVDGPPNMLPELWVAIWEAHRSGDLEDAQIAQKSATLAFESIWETGGGFHAIIKAGLSERLGIDCGIPRPPGAPLKADRMAFLRDRLAELDLPIATVTR